MAKSVSCLIFRKYPSLLAAITLIAVLVSSVKSRKFEFFNNCPYTVWAGTQANYEIPQLASTGFELKPNERKTLDAPHKWGGRMWGRTGCSQKGDVFSCETADCGGLECAGRGGETPATLAEFTLDGYADLDFYDVSLVDGFNMPVGITPRDGCPTTDCPTDVNAICPPELALKIGKRTIGCKSACAHFGTDEYCCSGEHATPDTCPPFEYSEVFAEACPQAYSYAYDDLRGTFTCVGGDYLITFCPNEDESDQHYEL